MGGESSMCAKHESGERPSIWDKQFRIIPEAWERRYGLLLAWIVVGPNVCIAIIGCMTEHGGGRMADVRFATNALAFLVGVYVGWSFYARSRFNHVMALLLIVASAAGIAAYFALMAIGYREPAVYATQGFVYMAVNALFIPWAFLRMRRYPKGRRRDEESGPERDSAADAGDAR